MKGSRKEIKGSRKEMKGSRKEMKGVGKNERELEIKKDIRKERNNKKEEETRE